MHIRGVNHSGSVSRVISLPRPDGSAWPLTISPLPLGFHRRLREYGLNPPAPPVKVSRDSHGKPLRDEQGLAVTTCDNTDPAYLAEVELYHQRVATLAVYHALQDDPNITFDTRLNGEPGHPKSRPNSADWLRAADAIHAELEAAGFTAGDLILLCEEVCRLSNLIGDHLKAARGNFLSSSPPQAP
ncbi:MAG: hypothetical protein R3B90_05575 [Planctomycetaceae bacterium]